MTHNNETKEELINEITLLKERIAGLETLEPDCARLESKLQEQK